jgi:TPR repeat protein
MLKKLCLVALMNVAGVAGASPGDEAYSRAQGEYEVCHYREAVTALREAARAGHTSAAQMLGTMLLVGPRLYGAQVPKDTAEGLRWLRVAAAAGNEAARFQVARLAAGQ